MTKRVTWCLILGIHLCIALIAISKKAAVKVRIPKKIMVTTVQLKPPPPQPKAKPTPKPQPKPKVLPKPKVALKPAPAQPKAAPKPAVAKPTVAPKPVAVKNVVQKPKPQPRPSSPPLVAPPAPIKNLSIDQEKVDESLKKIVEVMQTHLQLPEFGKVKLKLTLLADGSVKDIVVYDQESTANKVYLETHLKELNFPPLEQGAFKKDEETFNITFCNSA